MTKNTAAERLFQKYQEGTCSAQELAQLESWYNQYIPGKAPRLTDQQPVDSMTQSMPINGARLIERQENSIDILRCMSEGRHEYALE